MSGRPHGIMFHHFHDGDKHLPSQGSITAEQLEALIEHVGRGRILDASEFKARAVAGTLETTDLCVTFDDSLLCQYDIALPVLEKHGIKAFWFVYTSPLVPFDPDDPPRLEVYRRFRHTFKTMDAFYHAFQVAWGYTVSVPDSYLAAFPFYSDGDKWFRYVRDVDLGASEYQRVMDEMIEASSTSLRELVEGLWLTRENVKALHDSGHEIGLHSHTHPTTPFGASMEYGINRMILFEITGSIADSITYPCSRFDSGTRKYVRAAGIKLGFMANMVDKADDLLKMPREDHTNIMREIEG